MPNHITNILRVSGDPEKVRAMFEAIKDDKIGLGSLDFNKVIPMPAHIFRGNLGMAEREKYGKENWYDWSISIGEPSGTAMDTMVHMPRRTLTVSISSSRPHGAVRKMSLLYWRQNIPTYPLNTNGLTRTSDIMSGIWNTKMVRKCSAISLPAVPRKRWSLRLRFTMWIWPMRDICTMKKPTNMNIIIQMSRCH